MIALWFRFFFAVVQPHKKDPSKILKQYGAGLFWLMHLGVAEFVGTFWLQMLMLTQRVDVMLSVDMN